MMLANAIPAQERPDQALPTIKAAVNGAVALDGERGEAAEDGLGTARARRSAASLTARLTRVVLVRRRS